MYGDGHAECSICQEVLDSKETMEAKKEYRYWCKIKWYGKFTVSGRRVSIVRLLRQMLDYEIGQQS